MKQAGKGATPSQKKQEGVVQPVPEVLTEDAKKIQKMDLDELVSYIEQSSGGTGKKVIKGKKQTKPASVVPNP